jgi:hypothetical protein
MNDFLSRWYAGESVADMRGELVYVAVARLYAVLRFVSVASVWVFVLGLVAWGVYRSVWLVDVTRAVGVRGAQLYAWCVVSLSSVLSFLACLAALYVYERLYRWLDRAVGGLGCKHE